MSESHSYTLGKNFELSAVEIYVETHPVGMVSSFPSYVPQPLQNKQLDICFFGLGSALREMQT